MPKKTGSRVVLSILLASIAGAIVICGCSRTKHRVRADKEAYDIIEERNNDRRWSVKKFTIELNERSRYFDQHDPDRPPMPPDDPASHRYMYRVNGMKGWKHWHKNGHRAGLENPCWRDALGADADIDEDGAIKIDLQASIRLAYIHSPFHQRQVETLYLSSLDVATERFFLDTQFFGGYDARYRHSGSLIPANIGYNGFRERFVVFPPRHNPSAENNRLTIGRPDATNPALQVRRRFATAAELAVGFANSFVFEFTGPGGNIPSAGRRREDVSAGASLV